MNRIQALLRAGVNSFIDLTEAGELPPYDALLPHQGQLPVEHHRQPITDHGVPESPQVMAAILDTIEAQLAAGRCVYVHCRAGIGRTGMAMGCHLIRSGLDNEAALERLRVLWQQCARSRSWPSVPETEAQVEFVRGWQEPAQRHVVPETLIAPSFAQRCVGALLGLAIGEAMGILQTAGELHWSGAGELLVPQGVFTAGADIAMTQSVATSLLNCGGNTAEDQMQHYSEFIRSGQYTETGVAAANLAPEFKRAVAAWQWSRKANAGTHDPKNLDPHSLARSLAVALYRHADPAAAFDLAMEVSRTTQQSPVVLDTVRIWTALVIDALSGVDKAQFLDLQQGPSMQIVRQRPLRPELKKLLNGRWSAFPPNDGGALAVIARALLALQATKNFEQGMHQLFDPRATPIVAAAAAGALYGTLAGAHYGVDAIPESWQRALPQAQALRDLARRFAG
jgi:ADP-ribosylglycohydrolase/protein-tyrosine phosphatase